MIVIQPAAKAVASLALSFVCLPLAVGEELVVMPGSTPEAFGVAWVSEPGMLYEVQKSFDLTNWERVPNGRRTGISGEPILEIEYSGVPDPPIINEIETVLVDSGTVAKFLNPLDGSLGTSWTDPSFDDSGWESSPLGIGYDTAGNNSYDDLFGHDGGVESQIQAAMRGADTVPSMFLRVPFQIDQPVDVLTLNMRMDDGFVAYLNGVPVASVSTPDPAAPEWNATATESSDENITRGDGLTFDLTPHIATLVGGENVLAIHGMNKSTGDSDFLMLPRLFATRFEEQVETTTYLRVASKPAATEPDFAITEFMAVNDDLIFDEDGTSPDWIEIANLGDETASLRGWHLTDNSENLTKWTIPDIVLDAGESVIIFASGKDRTDLNGVLHTDFNLGRGGEFLALVAAGGTSVVSKFDPAAGDLGEQYANIAYGIPEGGGISGYLTDPTPGAPNGREVVNTGPAISAVVHTPDNGASDQAITVRATLKERAGPISKVDLVYRIMFGEEQRIPMSSSGNGAFTADIPADGFGQGEMVRYYISATDSESRTSRKPEFLKPEQSARYLGNLIQDSDIPETKLPILEWFVEDPRWHKEGGGNNRDWASVSVFYGGRFYDNIRVRTRGGGTQRLPKPNLKFDFYNGGHFTFDPEQEDVEEFNLQSFAGEIWTPSYMRNPLGYKTYKEAGMPASFSFYVHVRQNGDFYGLSAIEEQIDERFLRRHGMNDSGALYKAHIDAWLETERSQNKWETDWFKQIPEDLDYSDIAAFTEGLSLEDPVEREAFVFDNVNIPQVIHYLAVTVLGPNHDRLQHNYYVYRDTGGTDEWCFLPWDLDRWFPQSTQLSNATMRSIFYGDSDHERADSGIRGQYNRLNDALFDTPRTREMYVHHVRKVIDELTISSTFFEDSIDTFAERIELDADLDNKKWRLGRLSTGISTLKSTVRTRRRQLERDRDIPPVDDSPLQLAFGAIEPRQYIEIINERESAINLSGWKLRGAVDFTFQPGTVLLGTTHAPANVIFVSPDVRAFRLRTASPKGGEGHFVQGNYEGTLTPAGAKVELVDEGGGRVATWVRQ
jgi:hypothetical protein